MATKPNSKDSFWLVVGAAILLGLILLVMYFRNSQSPAELLASKARRLDLVTQMQAALASASEAEKSSVLATTDQDSETYANQARAATAELEQKRLELSGLLATGGTADEQKRLTQFSTDFDEFQKIDKNLLALAIQNTNLKAYDLAFGPAAAALDEMGAALSRLARAGSDAAVELLALKAQVAALHIQGLLAPHIAEESDQKMDALEAVMARDDQQVRQDLDALAALKQVGDSAALVAAKDSYERYSEIRKKILALSRANTNVRSLAISLNQKRKIMLVCQDDLAALDQAIRAEQIPGLNESLPR